jgi:hypothetical protein
VQALAEKPEKRPQSAKDFGEKLAEILTRKPEPKPIVVQPKPNYFKPLLAAVSIAVLALTIFLGGWWFWSNRNTLSPMSTENRTASMPGEGRVLTYWLMVKMKEKDGTLSNAFPSSGNQEYRSGSKFSFVFAPAQSGYLYIINEGPSRAWYVLFPNPKDNNGSAKLSANQELKTFEFPFDENTGVEKEWIIWSAQPVAELEKIYRAAYANQGRVSDTAQQNFLKDFFDKHAVSPPDVTRIEGDAPRVILKSRSEVLVNLLELSHKNY